jgi:hypothetical protein
MTSAPPSFTSCNHYVACAAQPVVWQAVRKVLDAPVAPVAAVTGMPCDPTSPSWLRMSCTWSLRWLLGRHRYGMRGIHALGTSRRAGEAAFWPGGPPAAAAAAAAAAGVSQLFKGRAGAAGPSCCDGSSTWVHGAGAGAVLGAVGADARCGWACWPLMRVRHLRMSLNVGRALGWVFRQAVTRSARALGQPGGGG